MSPSEYNSYHFILAVFVQRPETVGNTSRDMCTWQAGCNKLMKTNYVTGRKRAGICNYKQIYPH
jgi:hypothetical protein